MVNLCNLSAAVILKYLKDIRLQDGQEKHIEELKAFLEEQKDIPIEYDEQLVRRLVEKVTVFDEKIAVKFKSGVEIEVDR